MCWLFMSFYLESCSWPHAISWWSDKGTASNFVQISEKVRRRLWQWLNKRSGKRAWAIQGKSKLTGTEKGEAGEGQSKSMLIIFLDTKGFVHEEFVLAGQIVNSTYYSDILRQLHENVWRLHPELWEQKNWLLHHNNATSHISFSTRKFQTKKHDCRPHSTHFSVSPIEDKTERPPILHNWGDRGRIVGGAERPHRTRLSE
jgi:hypothetical protein